MAARHVTLAASNTSTQIVRCRRRDGDVLVEAWQRAFETAREPERPKHKQSLRPHLRPLWENAPSSRLVEPFSGGLAVALGLSPSRALLNDINPHLVNVYRQLKRGLRITIELANESDAYCASRRRVNERLPAGKGKTAEAASLF